MTGAIYFASNRVHDIVSHLDAPSLCNRMPNGVFQTHAK
jgi:hypothetical protein